jgi:hypothetical protein
MVENDPTSRGSSLLLKQVCRLEAMANSFSRYLHHMHDTRWQQHPVRRGANSQCDVAPLAITHTTSWRSASNMQTPAQVQPELRHPCLNQIAVNCEACILSNRQPE